MEELRGLAAFVRTAETLSFTAAARSLGISPSGVSNAINRLERHVGVRLLNRSTRSVSLTPDGANYFERCRRALAELEVAKAALADGRFGPHGQLRINLPRTIGRLHIAPKFPDFVARHPAVTIMAGFDDRVVDAIEAGWDLIVRVGAPDDSALVARKLGMTRLVTCASPSYLARNGVPERVADLHQHNCVQLVRPGNGKAREWLFEVEGELRSCAFAGSYAADNNEAIVAMGIAGAGVIQVYNYHLTELLHVGVLVPLVQADQAPGTPVSAIYPSARQLSPKVRAMVDFLAQILPPIL